MVVIDILSMIIFVHILVHVLIYLVLLLQRVSALSPHSEPTLSLFTVIEDPVGWEGGRREERLLGVFNGQPRAVFAGGPGKEMKV